MFSFCKYISSRSEKAVCEKNIFNFTLEFGIFLPLKYIALRKDMNLSETEVLQMQNAMRVSIESLVPDTSDEELIDTLIAISVVSRRLAQRLRKIKDEGDKQNESHE
jgi:hypothetical protein